jgi:acetylornithine deacetylase/succinyl-diaminopimelate desuccinylase-like protein
VLLIEASEESGSIDLPAHLEALGDRLGTPSLVIGLDSGCADWEHFWITTSLRGVANFFLTVEVLTEGVHSGAAGGMAPSSFRILRLLLDRLEDPVTGATRLPDLEADVPAERRKELEDLAELVTDPAAELPFAPGVRPEHDDPLDLLLAKTWAPALEIVGVGGAPSPDQAGNVLRPSTTVKLSMRLPPTVDADAAAAQVIEILVADAPYGAAVSCELEAAESGWAAPPTAPWLAQAIDGAADAAFGRPARAFGEGGTIPFMGMLGRQFPDAQFVITGVLGPGSNAHGPNEFLHIPTGKRVTEAVAHIVAAHTRR